MSGEEAAPISAAAAPEVTEASDTATDSAVKVTAGGAADAASPAEPEVGELADTAGLTVTAGTAGGTNACMAEPEAQATAPAQTVELFQLEEAEGEPASPDEQTMASREAPDRANSLDDWYGLDDSTANEQVAQTSAEAEDKGRRRVPKWLGGLGSNAKKLGGGVRKAIVSEAKLLVQDVRELSGNIKEGAQYTAEDSKVLAQSLRSGAKTYVEDTKALGSRVRKEGLRSVWKPGDEAAAEAESAEASAGDDEKSASKSGGDADRNASTAAASSASSALPTGATEDVGPSSSPDGSPTLQRESSSNSRLLLRRLGPVWQDLQEASKEIVSDLGETSKQMRQALRDQRENAAAGDGAETSPHTKAVRAKLWQHTTALVASFAADKKDEESACEPGCYWALPSSRANYVMLTEEALLEAAEAELELTDENRKASWRRLAGGFARRGEEVRQGIARRARDVGQIWDASSPTHSKDAFDVYVGMPSTRANYVSLSDPDEGAFFVPKHVSGEIRRIAGRLDADARKLASRLDDDVTERIGRLGDRIDEDGRKAMRGLAKRKEKVSQGLAETAQNVGHKLATTETPNPRWLRRRAADQDGDDIFEIGSEDDEDDWLDSPFEEGVGREANQESDTRSAAASNPSETGTGAGVAAEEGFGTADASQLGVVVLEASKEPSLAETAASTAAETVSEVAVGSATEPAAPPQAAASQQPAPVEDMFGDFDKELEAALASDDD
mmetsp:Transcript_13133/g.30692  ORF Transcript_13133/g.30692 Transcript_13133/m.30692 type:complete len:730 (+) Transcript_13133:49-2238(+)